MNKRTSTNVHLNKHTHETHARRTYLLYGKVLALSECQNKEGSLNTMKVVLRVLGARVCVCVCVCVFLYTCVCIYVGFILYLANV